MSDGSHNQPPTGLFDGRYRIIRPVGQGGMARVLLAEDADLHRPVALKILSERYAGDDAFVERFTREARAVAALNHPNIVQIYDRGTVNGQPYIAMEYVEGETLKHLISREAPLPPKRVIDIALQILAALRAAHKKDVIHRDIKPQNILLLADGRVKVTDFGIARAGASEMTEEGSVVGTAQYLAPEQARGLAVGPSADLYSTGVVVYEMLTGRVPFLGDSSVAIAMKHVQERPTPPRLVTPGIPPELEAVVMRALEKDPLLRYRTADEMGVELDRVRRALGNGGVTEATTVLPSEQRTTVVPPPRSRPLPPPTSGREIDLRQAVPPPPVRPVVPAYYDEDPDEARRSWPWLILIALLGIAAALALAMWQSGRDNGSGALTDATISIPSSASTISTTEPTTATTAEVSVPRVIGMPLDDATRILTNAKLQFNFTRQASDKPKDEVIDQSPAAGELVTEGEVIELTVSDGTATVAVPNVVGMTYAAALQALTDANLGAKKTEEPSGDVATGEVIRTEPPAGEQVDEGTGITVVVSSGATTVTVPSVAGESVETAQQTLIDLGFIVADLSQVEDPGVPAGQVIDTDPAAGQEVERGSAITIRVSTGPPPEPQTAIVPEILGQTEVDARALLEAAGISDIRVDSVATDNPADIGLVVSSDPAPGAEMAVNDQITLLIGIAP